MADFFNRISQKLPFTEGLPSARDSYQVSRNLLQNEPSNGGIGWRLHGDADTLWRAGDKDVARLQRQQTYQ
ncbi:MULTISPECIES: hypothetical protein [Pseudomonas]|uniref:hypothetical protein n=1 Tax=Pseudomonas TaxID=286 RepID=UPI0015E8E496|nr:MULTISPECIES: hypothetical protein [Pseudomonas]